LLIQGFHVVEVPLIPYLGLIHILVMPCFSLQSIWRFFILYVKNILYQALFDGIILIEKTQRGTIMYQEFSVSVSYAGGISMITAVGTIISSL